MCDENENNDENPSRMGNRDDETDNSEYPPNVVRLEPDIGLGNQRCNRKHRSNTNVRREESTISFRHFLQNEGGHSSNTTYPDLYSCSRQERPLVVDGSVVDPDSPDLPDFVQDHLAVEHMYFNDANCAQSVNLQNLPDFASGMSHVVNDEMRQRQQLGPLQSHDNRRFLRNRVPLDLPAPNPLLNELQGGANPSLPFDLTTQANVAPNSCESRSPADIELAGSGGQLPDFLSDGHVLAPNNSRHREVRVVASENGSGLELHAERTNIISVLRHENNRLRDELSVFQSLLMKKDDRIKELEDIVMALEISKLQMSADANTQTSSKSTGNDAVNHSKEERQSLKSEICKLQREDVTKFTESSSKYFPGEVSKQETNSNFTQKVREMTSSSERLARELLRIIVEMQQEMYLKDMPSSTSEHKSNNDPDDSAGGSASTV